MAQPSGQAGQEVGYSVNNQQGDKDVQATAGLTARARRLARADELTPSPIQGKERLRPAVHDPRYLQEVLAMVSHDLRTPLASINGMLALLRLGVCGELPDKALEAIQVAERGSSRLLKLVDELLDLEMLESTQPSIECAHIDTMATIQKSVDSVIGFAQMHAITIAVPSRGVPFCADEDRLVQVLVNLLSNAIKFSPDGTTVRISLVEGDKFVEFRVTDEGPGIPEANRQMLFERFSHVGTAHSTKLTGSGLGLAISKAIIDAHRGEIGCDSEVGVGTTFWFRVPKMS